MMSIIAEEFQVLSGSRVNPLRVSLLKTTTCRNFDDRFVCKNSSRARLGSCR